MRHAVLAAGAGLLMLGAAKAPVVDYRLDIIAQAAGPPVLGVEMRLAGNADGETRLDLPDDFGGAQEAWRYLYDLEVRGAVVSEGTTRVRVLRHRPGARITVRYKVRTAYEADPAGSDGNPYRGPIIRPQWVALLGDYVFASPEDRGAEAARFRWGRLPKGWRVASDLDHVAMGRRTTVADIVESFTLAAPGLGVTERAIPGGTLRVASLGAPAELPALADAIAPVIAAQRAYWNDQREPYFVGFMPLVGKPRGYSLGGTGRGDGFALYSTPNQADRLKGVIAHEHTHTWIPGRVGGLPKGENEASAYWVSEGFTDFLTNRITLRSGLAPLGEVAEQMNGTLYEYEASPVRTAPGARIVADFWKNENVRKLPYQRGQLLALKWDEDIRRKSGGKLDMDDVLLRMRDHYQEFPPGEGPDVVTSLVSAAWVVAGLDLQADIERYAVKGELVALPETLFDGCLDVRTNRRPTFDAGFDTTGSFAAKMLRGVRPRGPAWNTGVRDGQRLDAWTLKPGDTGQEVELVVRDNRGRPRTVRYWPYGDGVIEDRDLLVRPGMTEAETAACARKVGGL